MVLLLLQCLPFTCPRNKTFHYKCYMMLWPLSDKLFAGRWHWRAERLHAEEKGCPERRGPESQDPHGQVLGNSRDGVRRHKLRSKLSLSCASVTTVIRHTICQLLSGEVGSCVFNSAMEHVGMQSLLPLRPMIVWHSGHRLYHHRRAQKDLVL